MSHSNQDSDDEHFVDLEDEEKEKDETGPSTNPELQGSSADTSSWVHRQKSNDEGKGVLNCLNLLKTIWFCYNMDFPETSAHVFSRLVWTG